MESNFFDGGLGASLLIFHFRAGACCEIAPGAASTKRIAQLQVKKQVNGRYNIPASCESCLLGCLEAAGTYSIHSRSVSNIADRCYGSEMSRLKHQEKESSHGPTMLS